MASQLDMNLSRLDELRGKIFDRLVDAYMQRPVAVAKACDEMIDRSGNMLGWLRDAASIKALLAVKV